MKVQIPGPDGNAGAMGGNSSDQSLIEATYGGGGWSSPKTSSAVFDVRDMQ